MGSFSLPLKSQVYPFSPVDSLCSIWHSGSFSPSWNAPCLGYFLVSFDDYSSSAHIFKCKCSTGPCLPLLAFFLCLISCVDFMNFQSFGALLSGLDSQTHINTNRLSRSKLQFPVAGWPATGILSTLQIHSPKLSQLFSLHFPSAWKPFFLLPSSQSW